MSDKPATRPLYWKMGDGIRELPQAECNHSKYPLVLSAASAPKCTNCPNGTQFSVEHDCAAPDCVPASAPDALIERLRGLADMCDGIGTNKHHADAHREAADALAALKWRITELEERYQSALEHHAESRHELKQVKAERDALQVENEKIKVQREEGWQAFTRLRRAYSMVRYPTLTGELRLLYDTADAVAAGKKNGENNEQI
jgi:FtsZ-binding cell division protein ZapB